MSAGAWVAGRPARGRRRRRTLPRSTPTFAARTDHPFPLGVLAINLAGALALGLVAGAALSGEALVDRRRRRHRLLHHLLHLDARLASPRRRRPRPPRLAQPRPLAGRRLRRHRPRPLARRAALSTGFRRDSERSPAPSAPPSTLDLEMSEQTLIDSLETPPRVPLADLEDGQRVRGVYAVRERELRRKRNGEPWLRLMVGDSSGAAEAVAWEDAEALFALAAPGTAVFVAGVFEMSDRWGSKIKLTGLREATADEYAAEDLAAESDVSFEHLESDLRELLATVQEPQLRRPARPLLRRGLGDLGPLPRRPGGEGLPPGLPPRPARAHDLRRPGGQRRRRLLPRHRPRRRRHRRPPARHRQDRGLQRRPAGDRPHRRRPPPGRDPARLLPGPPRDRGDPRLRPRPWPRPSSTSSSATTARSSTAHRSSPPPARPSSST